MSSVSRKHLRRRRGEEGRESVRAQSTAHQRLRPHPAPRPGYPLVGQHPVLDGLLGGARLGRLAGRQHLDERRRRHARRRKRGQRRPAVPAPHVGVRDEHDGGALGQAAPRGQVLRERRGRGRSAARVRVMKFAPSPARRACARVRTKSRSRAGARTSASCCSAPSPTTTSYAYGLPGMHVMRVSAAMARVGYRHARVTPLERERARGLQVRYQAQPSAMRAGVEREQVE